MCTRSALRSSIVVFGVVTLRPSSSEVRVIEKVSAVVLSVERLMHDRFFLGPRTTVNWLIAPLVTEAVIHVREYIQKTDLKMYMYVPCL